MYVHDWFGLSRRIFDVGKIHARSFCHIKCMRTTHCCCVNNALKEYWQTRSFTHTHTKLFQLINRKQADNNRCVVCGVCDECGFSENAIEGCDMGALGFFVCLFSICPPSLHLLPMLIKRRGKCVVSSAVRCVKRQT